MEIKTAFSSQFNHDAAISGFWCAKHVFLFFSLKIGQEGSLLRITKTSWVSANVIVS